MPVRESYFPTVTCVALILPYPIISAEVLNIICLE